MEARKPASPRYGTWPGAVLTGCFVLGGLLGCLLGVFSSEGSTGEVSEYLSGYLAQVAGDGLTCSFLTSLWEQGRWLLLCLLFSLSGLGVMLIPALLCFRGLLVSFGVSCFLAVFGLGGMVPALVLFGLPGLLWVPGLFCAGAFCLERSAGILGARLGRSAVRPTTGRRFYLGIALCVVSFVLCGIIESRLLPRLLSWAAAIVG